MRFVTNAWKYVISVILIGLALTLILLPDDTRSADENKRDPSVSSATDSKPKIAPSQSNELRQQTASKDLKSEDSPAPPSKEAFPDQDPKQVGQTQKSQTQDGQTSETSLEAENNQDTLNQESVSKEPQFDKDFYEAYSDGKPMPKIDPSTETSWERFGTKKDFSNIKRGLSIVITNLGLDRDLITYAHETLPKTISFALLSSAVLDQQEIQNILQDGRELLIMVPLEPDHFPSEDSGFNSLLTGLDQSENRRRLHYHLSRFQGYVGVIPYKGLKFASSNAQFQMFLTELKVRKIAYVEPFNFPHHSETQNLKDHFCGRAKSTLIEGLDRQAVYEKLVKFSNEIDSESRSIITIAAARKNIDVIKIFCEHIERVNEKSLTLIPISKALSHGHEDAPVLSGPQNSTQPIKKRDPKL